MAEAMAMAKRTHSMASGSDGEEDVRETRDLIERVHAAADNLGGDRAQKIALLLTVVDRYGAGKIQGPLKPLLRTIMAHHRRLRQEIAQRGIERVQMQRPLAGDSLLSITSPRAAWRVELDRLLVWAAQYVYGANMEARPFLLPKALQPKQPVLPVRSVPAKKINALLRAVFQARRGRSNIFHDGKNVSDLVRIHSEFIANLGLPDTFSEDMHYHTFVPRVEPGRQVIIWRRWHATAGSSNPSAKITSFVDLMPVQQLSASNRLWYQFWAEHAPCDPGGGSSRGAWPSYVVKFKRWMDMRWQQMDGDAVLSHLEQYLTQYRDARAAITQALSDKQGQAGPLVIELNGGPATGKTHLCESIERLKGTSSVQYCDDDNGCINILYGQPHLSENGEVVVWKASDSEKVMRIDLTIQCPTLLSACPSLTNGPLTRQRLVDAFTAHSNDVSQGYEWGTSFAQRWETDPTVQRPGLTTQQLGRFKQEGYLVIDVPEAVLTSSISASTAIREFEDWFASYSDVSDFRFDTHTTDLFGPIKPPPKGNNYKYMTDKIDPRDPFNPRATSGKSHNPQRGGKSIAKDSGMGPGSTFCDCRAHLSFQFSDWITNVFTSFYGRVPLVRVLERFRVKQHAVWSATHVDVDPKKIHDPHFGLDYSTHEEEQSNRAKRARHDDGTPRD